MDIDDFLKNGEWEGFYCYNTNPKQHKMLIDFVFEDGKIIGFGNDDVAPHSWKGSYDANTFKAFMTKVYPSHSIIYSGEIDENGIWGSWRMEKNLSGFSPALKEKLRSTFLIGGFHIWPKKQAEETRRISLEEEINLESVLLKEYYEEHFLVKTP